MFTYTAIMPVIERDDRRPPPRSAILGDVPELPGCY